MGSSTINAAHAGRIFAAMRQLMEELPAELASPPDVHFKRFGVQPSMPAYITQDDFLQVTIYTTAATTGLTLALRMLDVHGRINYTSENLDGVSASTLTQKIIPLTEGFLLSLTVSNINGGLADQVCFVSVGLQKGSQASTAPNAVLAEGYVSNLYTINWPPVYVRGPASSSNNSSGLTPWSSVAGLAPSIAGVGLTTAWNQSGTFFQQNSTPGILMGDTTSAGGFKIEGTYGAYLSTPFTLTALFSLVTGGQLSACGLAVLASSSGKLINMMIDPGFSSDFIIQTASAPGTFVSTLVSNSLQNPAIAGIRLKDTGTAFTVYTSTDGYVWTQQYTSTWSASYLTAPPADLALAVNPQSGMVSATLLAWAVTNP